MSEKQTATCVTDDDQQLVLAQQPPEKMDQREFQNIRDYELSMGWYALDED